MLIRALRTGSLDPGDGESGDGGKTRGCLVRPSIVSREILLVAILAGVALSVYGIVHDGTPTPQTALNRLRGHDNLVENVIFAADGQTLISCGWDRQVRIWDVARESSGSGQQLASLPHSSHLFSVALTPDGKALGVAGVCGFSIWTNLPNRGWELRAEQEGRSHRSVAAAPDCRTLAVGSEDGTIRLWDIPSGKETSVLAGFHDEIRAVGFSADGATLVACAFNGEIRTWSMKSGGKPEPVPLRMGPADTFALAPDGRTLVIASGIGHASVLTFWDLKTGQVRQERAGSGAGNNALAFAPDGRVLACADRDGTLRLRDGQTGELVATFSEGVGWVKTVAFSPDGRRLAFGGKDGSVQFRDLPFERSLDPSAAS
jgi:WD40 repeat protein